MSTLRDRLPPNVTPTGSPPRRGPYSAQRPSNLGIAGGSFRGVGSPGTSSLSLASSASDLLPDAGRRPNGSYLKQTVTTSPPPDAADPLVVLEGILRRSAGEGKLRAKVKPESVDEKASQHALGRPKQSADIDFGGLSLEQYVREAEKDPQEDAGPTTLPKADIDKSKLEELHTSISACDDVLKTVETYLTSFRGELGTVSAELEALQTRSTLLSTRLDNRKKVERVLGPAIEEISVSPVFVRTIAEGPIDEKWARALESMEKHTNVSDGKFKNQDVKALEDVKPLLENLQFKAVERSRDHIVNQIKALRSATVNIQIQQQTLFLPYKALFAFLHKENSQLAEEICQAYVNTARWYFLNSFTRYQKALDKIKLHVIDKTETIGTDEQGKKGNIGSKGAGVPVDPFNIGRRADCLRSAQLTALSAYIAEEEKTVHYMEVPFRSFNVALVDNASAEYTFMTQFFAPLGYHKISKAFGDIFEPTFQLGRTITKSLIESTVDCLGVLLCVRINQRLAFQLQRRKIPTVDPYINATNMLLWPRFQKVMDIHNESLRKLNVAKSSNANLEASKQSAAPHMVTQRFAQFTQGILVLSTEGGDDEPVSSSLSRSRMDFEALMQKLSNLISDSRKKQRFLYNNYSLVGTIIADTQGNFAEEQKEHFDTLKQKHGE